MSIVHILQYEDSSSGDFIQNIMGVYHAAGCAKEWVDANFEFSSDWIEVPDGESLSGYWVRTLRLGVQFTVLSYEVLQ